MTPRQGHGGRPKKYCSEKCRRNAGYLVAKLKKDAAKIVYNKACNGCQNSFVTNQPKHIFCSSVCRKKVRSIFVSEQWRKNNPRPDVWEYTCTRCNVVYQRNTDLRGIAVKYGYFCPPCSIEMRRIRDRRKGVKRRGHRADSRTSVEQLVAIYGSDCSICGEDIDVLLPRTSKRGATIDHIIPLSKGGTDEFDNLQLAHWICNNWKADRIL